MLESAHVLVVNSKNLLDTIDQVKMKMTNSSDSVLHSPLHSRVIGLGDETKTRLDEPLSVQIA